MKNKYKIEQRCSGTVTVCNDVYCHHEDCDRIALMTFKYEVIEKDGVGHIDLMTCDTLEEAIKYLEKLETSCNKAKTNTSDTRRGKYCIVPSRGWAIWNNCTCALNRENTQILWKRG